MPPKGKRVTASEIGQYLFCRRAWWLGTVHGYRPGNETDLTDGVLAHNRHGRIVRAMQRWQQMGYALLTLGGILGIFLLCRWLGGGA